MSDWSSGVCSADLVVRRLAMHVVEGQFPALLAQAGAGERDTAADPRRGGAVVKRQVEHEAGRDRAAGGGVVERVGAGFAQGARLEARRAWKGCVSACGSWWVRVLLHTYLPL